MPNRILKESICTSDNLDPLTAFQEVFFYRLIVNCDDYGRMDARPKILAARLFPLRNIREDQIKDALRALTSAELVTLYEVGGKPFLQMKTWEQHQRIRNQSGKYPAPEEGRSLTIDSNSRSIDSNSLTIDSNSRSIDSNSRSIDGLNPIQLESELESESEREYTRARTRETAARFEKFWAAYPRHENRKKAEAVFEKINPDDALLDRMLASIAAWAKSEQWTKDGKAYIPHPSTWLNGRRWEDDAPPPAGAKSVQAQQYEQRSYSESGMDILDALAIMERGAGGGE